MEARASAGAYYGASDERNKRGSSQKKKGEKNTVGGDKAVNTWLGGEPSKWTGDGANTIL